MTGLTHYADGIVLAFTTFLTDLTGFASGGSFPTVANAFVMVLLALLGAEGVTSVITRGLSVVMSVLQPIMGLFGRFDLAGPVEKAFSLAVGDSGVHAISDMTAGLRSVVFGAMFGAVSGVLNFLQLGGKSVQSGPSVVPSSADADALATSTGAQPAASALHRSRTLPPGPSWMLRGW